MRWIRFNLFSQLIDHHSQILRFLTVVRSPDGLQNSAMRQRLALIRNQMFQDVKFFRRQVHFLAPHRQLAAFKIQS